MAKNDKLLIDGIIDDRIANKNPSEKRDEAFEYLAFEQILKDFDLSSDEIQSGWIDGGRDGGIDGFFIFVNGHLLQEFSSFMWPKTSSELQLILITCKHHDTFKQATLDAVISTLAEILQLSIEDDHLTGLYSENLLILRQKFKNAYRKLSPRLSNFSATVHYASRGDTSELGEEVEAKGQQIAKLFKDNFGPSCKSNFSFIGSTELVELHRKIPNYTLELPFVAELAKGERYVVLVRLTDYLKFVSEDGKLRRYLFESNVRDFMGLNRVNEDIRATLENRESPDFWLLNNGITILATSAAITGNSIQATEVQIVNGLQTTESIFRHFQKTSSMQDDRCVLVKVIVTKDSAVRDAIIRATNNQTNVELASLHATDKIQRDIEDILLKHGFFYERRKNFYLNMGNSITEIITPLYAAAGYVSLILKEPHTAVNLRSNFMRFPSSYEKIFNNETSLEIWPKVVNILKKIDNELVILRKNITPTDRFLKGWRYIIAFFLVAKNIGKFSYSIGDFLKFDVSCITTKSVDEIFSYLQNNSSETKTKGLAKWRSKEKILSIVNNLSTDYGILDPSSFSNKSSRKFNVKKINQFKPTPNVSEQFIEDVKKLLPEQPWKPGMHFAIKEKLLCSEAEIFAAINKLIERGACKFQKDGILYDGNGNVSSFDKDRVDPITLKLRRNLKEKN